MYVWWYQYVNQSKEHNGNKQFIMLLNVQNVYFKYHWIVEYIRDQYILKNPKHYKTYEENETFIDLARRVMILVKYWKKMFY